MRLLCRYAGGLACLVTALALVACGGGPGSQPEPKQIKDSTLEVGKSLDIPLGDKFSGADLTYSATTSDVRVATVTVDNDADTLTVTAVAAGTATITVTAKNSRGEAKQNFTVTVPKPPAPDPEPVEIGNITFQQGEKVRTIPLSDKFSGSALTYDATTSAPSVATVTVNNTADTLVVTAVGPGPATITVTATAQGSATQTKTFTVTVPQPEVTAPTVKANPTRTADVVIGTPMEVALSTVFDGATSYAASSSASTIATASVSGETLTITGAGAGSATITVTGTNTAGSTEHPITATVTAPPPVTTTPTPTPTNNPSSCKSPLTIQRDDHADCTLPNDHSLVYSKPDGEEARVRVNGPDSSETRNVWTITARRKGRPVVQIRDDGTGNTVGEITVVVPNSPPRLKDIDGVLSAPDTPGTPDTPGVPGAPTLITLTPNTTTGRHTITTTPMAINAAFEDADDVDTIMVAGTGETAGNGIFNYKVQHKPDELLITTVRGFLLPKNSARDSVPIEAVVLKPFTENFSIEVYAYDPNNAQSDHPITVNFSATTDDPVKPVAGTYAVKQKENGDFEPVRVGNRLSIPGTNNVVEHTLQFFDANGLERRTFQFASNLNGTLIKEVSGKAYLADTAPAVATFADVPLCGTESNINTVQDKESLALGTGCYTYTTTDKVSIVATNKFTAGSTPAIEFTLPSKTNGLNSGSATITIKYYVHAYSARHVQGDSDNIPENAATRIHTATESLRINIHKCVTTEDCPID